MPGAGTLGLISEAAGVGLGVAETISSAINLRNEKRELAKLRQPFSKIQDEYFQDRNIAASEAMGGLPGATKEFLGEQKRRGLGTGIAALLESGSQPGDISQLFDVYDKSLSADAAKDAEAHTANIDYFIKANKDLAGQKTSQFAINELAPYERKLKQLTESMATNKANIFGGLQTAIGGLSAGGVAMSNDDLLSGIGKKKSLPDSGHILH